MLLDRVIITIFADAKIVIAIPALIYKNFILFNVNAAQGKKRDKAFFTIKLNLKKEKFVRAYVVV